MNSADMFHLVPNPDDLLRVRSASPQPIAKHTRSRKARYSAHLMALTWSLSAPLPWYFASIGTSGGGTRQQVICAAINSDNGSEQRRHTHYGSIRQSEV